MRFTIVAPAAAVVAILATACVPPAGPPSIGQPGYCGQTADGKAVVALTVDLGSCPSVPGQKQIGVADLCGPIMQGSNTIDDCWRGNIPGLPSPDNFRLGHIQAAGGQAINFVASDATAS
jgi:hypothetical protein